MTAKAGAHAEFGMYPFESVAWAWDELWAAVHERAPWTPGQLTRSGDVHARWDDADCSVTQVCGWPFADRHRNHMHLIGAFSLDLPEADEVACYRSVLLAAEEIPLSGMDFTAVHAAVNGNESLSGWHSLRAATVGPGGIWPGPVTFTGTHRGSLIALSNGDADLASIDSWSLALVSAEEPELVRDLHRVGLGPLVPTPAITARMTVSPESAEELRAAFTDAVADPSLASALDALRIDEFARLDVDDYLATLPLGLGR